MTNSAILEAIAWADMIIITAGGVLRCLSNGVIAYLITWADWGLLRRIVFRYSLRGNEK